MTKEEIARAKELDLLTYFKLVEPGNLKLVGKEYRHKVHSSLTISKCNVEFDISAVCLTYRPAADAPAQHNSLF